MSAASKKILKIDASARRDGSMTRELSDKLVTSLLENDQNTKVLTRDVSAGLPFLDAEWIGANFTDPADRTPEQKLKLALSDTLVAELRSADTIVFGVPVYNFSIPATLKTWVDMIARARETFLYTEEGPQGLLEGKKAYVIVASGGTPVGSEIDFASTYLRHVLGFIGITDVTVIAADQLTTDVDAKRDEALERIREAVSEAA
ncbi:FMN-dependent NADH-azoreductase [Roseibium sp.]|uniref:FMN-dependent NADH-azoreductase n=1 Tax=Roseibium sp. TaxID=1936156 RepID=UPI003A98420F